VFDWDYDNVTHLAIHGVTPEEAEEALLDPRRIGAPAYRVRNEMRYGAIGSTEEGRVLFVVFTRRRGLIRAIHARDAPRPERRRYQKGR
jgi:uncharacterized DUF497 family protein